MPALIPRGGRLLGNREGRRGSAFHGLLSRRAPFPSRSAASHGSLQPPPGCGLCVPGRPPALGSRGTPAFAGTRTSIPHRPGQGPSQPVGNRSKPSHPWFSDILPDTLGPTLAHPHCPYPTRTTGGMNSSGPRPSPRFLPIPHPALHPPDFLSSSLTPALPRPCTLSPLHRLRPLHADPQQPCLPCCVFPGLPAGPPTCPGSALLHRPPAGAPAAASGCLGFSSPHIICSRRGAGSCLDLGPAQSCPSTWLTCPCLPLPNLAQVSRPVVPSEDGDQPLNRGVTPSDGDEVGPRAALGGGPVVVSVWWGPCPAPVCAPVCVYTCPELVVSEIMRCVLVSASVWALHLGWPHPGS